jgi:uncharacterized protein YqfB (UPF0267 family)
MHHDLKILTTYFPAVLDGSKPFEIRDNSDRNFQQGDTVTLNEWDGERYTGRQADREITFVTDYAQQPGFVVFGMRTIQLDDDGVIQTIYHRTATDLLACFKAWEPDVRVLGNVRAGDAVTMLQAVIDGSFHHSNMDGKA